MKAIFTGTIEAGKIKFDRLTMFQDHVRSLEGKRVEVTLGKQVKRRTNPQNRYLHGVVIKLIEDSTGTDPDVIKQFLKESFGAKVFFGNTWVPKPTHMMDTIEMTELVEKARRWALEFLNVDIPSPEEVTV